MAALSRLQEAPDNMIDGCPSCADLRKEVDQLRLQIEALRRKSAMQQADCSYCGNKLEHRDARSTKRYCSPRCARRAVSGDPDIRFWAKVDRTPGHGPNGDCWIWTSWTDKKGYGLFSLNGREEAAHRYSYRTKVKAIPSGYLVCHKCDNPPCVRPDHLFTGTNAQNTQDRNQKGRQARGSRSGVAKLTEEAVREIRASQQSMQALAEKYGVTTETIKVVKRGGTWKHVL